MAGFQVSTEDPTIFAGQLSHAREHRRDPTPLNYEMEYTPQGH
jgi:hypothetical protein